MNVSDLVRLNALARPDDCALVVGRERFSYAALDRLDNVVASALSAWGVRPGARIAVLAWNSVEYVQLYFAAAKIGAILVPLNCWYRAPELQYLIENCDPSLLFADAAFDAVLDEALLGTAGERVPRITLPSADSPRPDAIRWIDFIGRADSDAEPGYRPAPADAHQIIYTSGTTGRPKGAVLSHDRTMRDAFAMASVLRPRQDDVFLNTAVPFHVGNWDHQKVWFLVGATVVLERKFEAGEALKLIESERVTVLLPQAAKVHRLITHPRFSASDVSTIRLLYFGAFEAGKMVDTLSSAFPGAELLHMYGLSEGGPIVAVCPPEQIGRKPGSIGRPIPGVEVELRDDHGQAVPVGEPGELQVRGPMMSGYWRNAEETARTLVDGWLLTGDIAVRDTEGYLRLVDRKKDVIRSGGHNIYSKEVENCLITLDGVAEVAVFGVADPVFEEQVVAAVVLEKDVEATDELADALRERVRERIAGYNVPRHIYFVESLPKNPIGKIVKAELRKRHKAQSAPGRELRKTAGAG